MKLRLLVLAIAAVLVPLAAAPTAGAAKRTPSARAGTPQATCAATKRRAIRRVRACARLGAGRLTSSARTALLGAPGGFATPAPFATADDAPVPGPAAPAPAPTAPEPPGPTLPPVYSNPRAVQVQAVEFGLQLSKSTVLAGNVAVEFNSSRAEDAHNLILVRADGDGPLHAFDEQPSGAVSSRSLPLTAGRWTLFCSLAGHEAAGMRATLSVAAD